MFRISGFWIAGLLGCLAGVQALYPYQKYEEGSCSTIKWPSGAGMWNLTEMEWVNSLPLKAAGNKYHLYRIASTHPHYSIFSESDFQNQFCYNREIFSNYGKGQYKGYGFGTLLTDFDLKMTAGPGRYGMWEYTSRSLKNPKEVIWQKVTASNGKKWAFLTGCWQNSDQKIWSVVSSTAEFSLEDRRTIIDHAVQQGFKRENFVFLNYDSCDLDLEPYHAKSGISKIRLPSAMNAPRKPVIRKIPQRSVPEPPQLALHRANYAKIQAASPPPLKRYSPVTTKRPALESHESHEETGGWGWSK